MDPKPEIDPDELFKHTPLSPPRSEESYSCTSEYCDKGSWCDGIHSYSGEIWRNRGWGMYASDSVCGGSDSRVVKSINEIEKSPEKNDDSESPTKSVPVEKISEKDEKEKLEKNVEEKEDDNFGVVYGGVGDDVEEEFSCSQS
ncbi:Frizzled and smoothened-like protein C [Bienertia sinuspersici]